MASTAVKRTGVVACGSFTGWLCLRFLLQVSCSVGHRICLTLINPRSPKGTGSSGSGKSKLPPVRAVTQGNTVSARMPATVGLDTLKGVTREIIKEEDCGGTEIVSPKSALSANNLEALNDG